MQFKIDGKHLIIYDDGGRKIGHYLFDFDAIQGGAWPSYFFPAGLPSAIRDLDGDGDAELLVAITPAEGIGDANRLYCFDRRGNRLWDYQPAWALRYGSKEYAPPYSVDFFRLILESNAKTMIWVAAHQIPEFPSVLAKLDTRGKVLGTYWHAGHLGAIAEARIAGRRVILLGSTNNEYLSASLSVLDYENPTGFSPAVRDDYRCGNCPPGTPIRYIVFPRSELSRQLGAREMLREIRVRPSGEIELTISTESNLTKENPAQTFVLDSNFHLRRIDFVDGYVKAHNELQASQLVDHRVNLKREAEALKPILYWDGSRFAPMRKKRGP